MFHHDMATNSSKLVCCGFPMSNVLALSRISNNCSTSEGRIFGIHLSNYLTGLSDAFSFHAFAFVRTMPVPFTKSRCMEIRVRCASLRCCNPEVFRHRVAGCPSHSIVFGISLSACIQIAKYSLSWNPCAMRAA